jgi:hypothetical protein
MRAQAILTRTEITGIVQAAIHFATERVTVNDDDFTFLECG